MLCGDLNGKEIQKGVDVCVYKCKWFTLLYSRNKYDIVKQLNSNKIDFKNRKYN